MHYNGVPGKFLEPLFYSILIMKIYIFISKIFALKIDFNIYITKYNFKVTCKTYSFAFALFLSTLKSLLTITYLGH